MKYSVRPTSWLLPILCPGLGWWWPPLAYGRVVDAATECGNWFYKGDGPSLGPVTPARLAWAIPHDIDYRAYPDRSEASRRATDMGVISPALQWLACPILRLAWRYRWGGFQDMPCEIWYPFGAVYAAIAWGAVILVLG